MMKNKLLDLSYEKYVREGQKLLKDSSSQKIRGKTNIPGMQGNLRGKKGRNWPFWTFQSTGFRAVASSLSKTSSLLGVGTDSSTCCKGKV